MRCTASAATSAGPTTRPIGSVARSSLAARLELVAEQRCRQRRVDEAGGDQVDPDRGDLERQAGGESGQRGGDRRDDARRPMAGLAAAGAAHEQQRAAGADLAGARGGRRRASASGARGARGAPRRSPSRPAARSTGRRRSPSRGRSGPARPSKKRLEGGRVVGVERRGAPRAELARRVLQPLGIAAGQDRRRRPRRGPAAPSRARCRRCRRSRRRSARAARRARMVASCHRAPSSARHRRSAPTGLRAAAISWRSAFSAAT